MPKIEIKEPTLNGQACIIKYAERESLYLRVNRGGKRYTVVSLNTTSIAQAHKNALSAYVKIESEPPRSRSNKTLLTRVCDEYLEEKSIDVARAQLSPRSQDLYRQRIYQRILPYCKSKGLRYVGEISKKSFTDYAGYYSDVKQKGKWQTDTVGLSTGTINSDITTLRAFFNWLVERELLDPKKMPDIKKLKDRTNYKDEANPAFLPDDWRIFEAALYSIEKEVTDEELRWKRRWFIHWVRFQYQSGCRPHETAQIRVGDCDVLPRRDGKISGIVKVSNTTKTGGRDVAMNENTIKNIKSHLTKGIKIRNEQIDFINQRIANGELKDKKGSPLTTPLPKIATLIKDDFLMMNLFIESRTVYHIEHIRQWYNRVLAKCEFDRRYTLYSLRSTHISFALLRGQPVNLVAKNCGTSLAMIQKTYDGLSSRYHIDSLGFFKDSSGKDAKEELLNDVFS